MNSTTRYKSTNPNACLKSQNNAIHPHTPSSSSLIPTLSLFPASQPSEKPSQTIRFFQSKPALRIPCFQHHTSGYPCSLLSPTHCQDHEKNTEHGTLTHVQKLQHLLKRYSRDHPWLTEFSRFPLQPLLQTFQLMSYWVTFHYSATCTPFLWHSHLASDLTSVSIQPPPQSQRSRRPGKPSPKPPQVWNLHTSVQGPLPEFLIKSSKPSAALGTTPSFPTSASTTSFSLQIHLYPSTVHLFLLRPAQCNILPEAFPSFPTQPKQNCLLF